MASPSRPAAAKLRAVATPPSPALQRLKAGEITLEQYLEERTERALDHVRGKVSADMLDTVRETLREQLRSDPVLIELVRRTTGQMPEPPAADPR